MKKILLGLTIVMTASILMAGAAITTFVPNTLKFGTQSVGTKDLIFESGSGSLNPRLRFSSGVLQFSNDGVIYEPLSGGTPSGSVTMYGGESAPQAWLLCDGTSYTGASNVALFCAIGINYGSTDGVRSTGDVAASTNTILNTVPTAGITNGMYIRGDNIPCGTTVVSVLGSTVTMSANATGTAVGENIQFAGNFNVPDMRGEFPRGVTGGSAQDPDAAARVANNANGNTGNNVGSEQPDQVFTHVHAITKFFIQNAGALASSTVATNSGVGLNGAAGTMNSNAFGGSETRAKNVYFNFIIKQ